MKKLFYSLFAVAGLLASLTSNAQLTTSVVVSSGGFSNVFTGPGVVSQIVIASAADNVAGVKIYDTGIAYQVWTNSAYSYTTTYATNNIQCYTNFFGVQNCYTNTALLTVSNYNAGGTITSFPVRINTTTATNSTTTLTGNYNFLNGMYVTNTGAASFQISVTYENQPR